MFFYWEHLMYIVVVLTITIANLFALRQKELKRFMAFSSISQAGYIMLAAIGTLAISCSCSSTPDTCPWLHPLSFTAE